ncbi:Cytochrome c oxidase subunit 6b-2 [Trichinella zimbabwensis]|uniref:Cytochrome c oxidase subunit 6b-2 n=1 Tax=Trichinella zimbabwensis TaxID=268475 RepID=A0A0V1HME7_9BILA|nr:Cytochrome c oxidase subunit 6b-2 [Trichinella zimbabwensis]
MVHKPKSWMENWDDVTPGKLVFPPDSKKYFDKEANEAIIRNLQPRPVDLRFTQCNRTKECYTYYINYHRCMNLKGNSEDCKLFKALYEDICPQTTIEKWDTWVAEGRYPNNLKY